MRLGTAIFILGILYLFLGSERFRTFCFGLISLAGIAILCLIWYGSDKPQTIFYDHGSHPAYLLRAGDTCAGDRHVWNGWCVK